MSDPKETEVEEEKVKTLESTEEEAFEVSTPESNQSADESKEEKKRPPSQPTETFTAFTKELESIPEPENKLKRTIQFMEEALSQENGVPHFKNFWDARDVCLKLFKENLSHQVREVFWGQYSELSREARRLKGILDEQSAFAMEQIEIAIKALEEEIASLEDQKGTLAPIDFEVESKLLEKRFNFYGKVQAELNLLNAYAARINSLRKELIKTDMRVRHKNKFFQRLSKAGDLIFPRRKDLIAEISKSFVKDTEEFISSNFGEGSSNQPSFVLRDEIKAHQSIAKVLTLNTHAFTSTRAKLSEGWDQLKEISRERKKARMEEKAELKENAEAFKVRIDAVSQSIEANEKSIDESLKELDAISKEMRDVKLGRDEVRFLRDALKDAKAPINAQIEAENQRREQERHKKEEQRKAKLEELREAILTLKEEASQFEVEVIEEKRAELQRTLADGDFRKMEKRELELLMRPIADMIQDKKEQALMNLSDDDQKALQQLREVLDQRLVRRQEIKEQLEIYRKEVGSSSLDFEKAIAINEQINSEKERLEHINQGIEEIEVKIEELESKAY